MGYYINLENISINEYKDKLETLYLPPSRLILKEQKEERFEYFKSIGINNIKQLQTVLKNKNKLTDLQKVNCFDGDYLKILLRELNSMLPKPNKIKEFKGISADTVSKLEKVKIKTTEHLFYHIQTKHQRIELAEITKICIDEIYELSCLTDLSRIKWVGVSFARMLYDLGITTAEKATKCDANKLHEQINRINQEQGFYRGKIGLNDIKIFIEAAKEISLDIEL